MFDRIVPVDFTGFLRAVRILGGHGAMADVDAGYRVQGEERTVVVMAMVIGTLHQGALWIKVAYFQVSADRCMEVAEDLSASRAVMKCIHRVSYGFVWDILFFSVIVAAVGQIGV